MREKLRADLEIRENSNTPDELPQIRVSMDECGIAAGAKAVLATFVEELAARRIRGIVTQTGCAGHCKDEPTVETRIWGSSSGVLLFSRISRSARSFSRMRRNSSGVFIFAMFSGRLEFDFSGLFAPACRKISRKRSFFRDRVVKYNHLLSK